MNDTDEITVGIAQKGVQKSYAKEIDISKDIPHVCIAIMLLLVSYWHYVGFLRIHDDMHW